MWAGGGVPGRGHAVQCPAHDVDGQGNVGQLAAFLFSSISNFLFLSLLCSAHFGA